MARRYVLSLVIGLLYIQVATALANTPQQKKVHTRSSSLSRSKAIVCPVTMSQVVDIDPLPNIYAQQVPASTVARQDDMQQRRYIAEEMVMQRAWLYSSVLPGSGQIYNKHYWKVPVIYVGFAGLLAGAIYYHKEYIGNKRVLLREAIREARRDNVASLANYVDDCRRGRDLYLIFAALWYIVNIFDAYVGASLKTFTLSDDISMEVRPNVFPIAESKPVIGISLTLSFNNENTPDRLWKNGSSR